MTQGGVKCQLKAHHDGRDFGKVIPFKLWFSSLESGHNHHFPNKFPLEVVMPFGREGREGERVGILAAGSSSHFCLLKAPSKCCGSPEKWAGPPQP